MTRYILALDQGTTSSRAILFNRAGQVVAMTQQELTQHFPHPGWVEHDPEEIWQSQLHVAQKLLHDNHITGKDIAAIGITNQRETTILWDRTTGEPLGRAIVWQDRRTAALCHTLSDNGQQAVFQQKTGLVLDAYFSGTKLRWLLDHHPGAHQRAERGELAFGTIDSWLVYRLTGEHVTDVSNASRTLLCNIHTGNWDDELLALLNIPRQVLPRIVSSSEEIALTHAAHFGHRIPISGIAGDQQAAAFGQGCLSPGMVKNTYGTGCFLLMHTGQQNVTSHNHLISTIGWRQGPSAALDYMLEGSVFMGGAVVQWLRDGMGIIDHAADIEALAASVPDSHGVVLVPAFTGLGAPHWDPDARGSIFGLTRGTTKAHIAHAALQSIALQTCDVITAMQQDAGIHIAQLRVDGGASRNDLLMQMQADLLNVPVIRPKVTETSALGAAFLAGLACGFWSRTEELLSLWQTDKEFMPAMHEQQRSKIVTQWYKAIQRSQAWMDAFD